MDESAYVLQRGKEGLMPAYKFEMQLYLFIYCDKYEVAVQLLRALWLYPEGQRKWIMEKCMQGIVTDKILFDVPCTESNMRFFMLRIVKQNQNYKGTFGNQYNLKLLFCVVPVASDSFQGPHTSPQAYVAGVQRFVQHPGCCQGLVCPCLS